MPPVVFDDVLEKSTVFYTATVVDEDGTGIPAASLLSLTLTLYNLDDTSLTVINSRNAQNVLNANNVTVDSSGNLEWAMQPDDNAIIDTNLHFERHRALFTWTWSYGAGTGTGRHEVDFHVRNLYKVT